MRIDEMCIGITNGKINFSDRIFKDGALKIGDRSYNFPFETASGTFREMLGKAISISSMSFTITLECQPVKGERRSLYLHSLHADYFKKSRGLYELAMDQSELNLDIIYTPPEQGHECAKLEIKSKSWYRNLDIKIRNQKNKAY